MIVLASFRYSASILLVFGPISRIISSASISSRSQISEAGVISNMVGHNNVNRKRKMTTFLFHDLHDFFTFADKGRLSQRSTDVMTFSQKERVGIPPPTIKVSTSGARCFKMVSFVETLEPPTIATSGRLASATAFVRALISWQAEDQRRRLRLRGPDRQWWPERGERFRKRR